MDFLRLAGKEFLVFGVANRKSVAYHIAKQLEACGARVVYVVRSPQRRDSLAKLLGDAELHVCDVEHPDQIARLRDELSEGGRLFHGLVHSIAFADYSDGMKPFHETGKAQFLRAVDISCYSLIDLTRRARAMMGQGGTVLTLTYQGSNRVTPNYNVMGVAKAALESTVRYLANDLGPEGIRVNAISPGPMKTLAGAAIGGARATFRHTEANAPMRSNATLQAVGGTAVWLASDAGAFTTGEIVRVDGGFHVLGMPQAENL